MELGRGGIKSDWQLRGERVVGKVVVEVDGIDSSSSRGMRWRDGQVMKWMTRYVWQVLDEEEGSRLFPSRRDLGILEV